MKAIRQTAACRLPARRLFMRRCRAPRPCAEESAQRGAQPRCRVEQVLSAGAQNTLLFCNVSGMEQTRWGVRETQRAQGAAPGERLRVSSECRSAGSASRLLCRSTRLESVLKKPENVLLFVVALAAQGRSRRTLFASGKVAVPRCGGEGRQVECRCGGSGNAPVLPNNAAQRFVRAELRQNHAFVE